MKLTQELIDQIQEAMEHTNLKGEINWKDSDDIEVKYAVDSPKHELIGESLYSDKDRKKFKLKDLDLGERVFGK